MVGVEYCFYSRDGHGRKKRLTHMGKVVRLRSFKHCLMDCFEGNDDERFDVCLTTALLAISFANNSAKNYGCFLFNLGMVTFGVLL